MRWGRELCLTRILRGRALKRWRTAGQLDKSRAENKRPSSAQSPFETRKDDRT
jgi:hypothetical protein